MGGVRVQSTKKHFCSLFLFVVDCQNHKLAWSTAQTWYHSCTTAPPFKTPGSLEKPFYLDQNVTWSLSCLDIWSHQTTFSLCHWCGPWSHSSWFSVALGHSALTIMHFASMKNCDQMLQRKILRPRASKSWAANLYASAIFVLSHIVARLLWKLGVENSGGSRHACACSHRSRLGVHRISWRSKSERRQQKQTKGRRKQMQNQLGHGHTRPTQRQRRHDGDTNEWWTSWRTPELADHLITLRQRHKRAGQPKVGQCPRLTDREHRQNRSDNRSANVLSWIDRKAETAPQQDSWCNECVSMLLVSWVQ